MNTNANNSLWASAFVLMALILFAASKHTPKANAESSISGNGFTMVTTPSGRGTDLLYLIDSQNEVLMIYYLPDPKQKTEIDAVAAWKLPNLFSSVRK
jgi:hypothetical protein